jgi:signal transduction histidine kinase
VSLRGRLVAIALGIAAVLAVVVTLLDGAERRRQVVELLSGHVSARVMGEGLAMCDRAPDRWARPPTDASGAFLPPPGAPPPPPGAPLPGPHDVPEVFPYDAALAPLIAGAPAIDDATLRAVQSGAVRVPSEHDGVDSLLVRVSGRRCAWVLARKHRPPLFEGAVVPLARAWGPPLLAMLAAIGFGLGPVVRRIRRLDREVRASAKARYRGDAITVEGRDELGALARSFAEAAREVREAIDVQEARERTLREFLANTTHDVMTPLTALQGHLSTLESAARAGEAITPEVVSAAIDEVVYTTSLVRNLEVAARLEAGEPHVARAPVDLARHRPLARQRRVELAFAEPDARLVVDGDETFLEQAIGNLVFNAIRHHRPDGGHVAVVLEARESRGEGGDRFRLQVLDDGPGVPADELARIAERSVRGEAARTRHPDGKGLGLAIVRRVCELHAMSLTFANADEGGLVVTIEGPAASSKAC